MTLWPAATRVPRAIPIPGRRLVTAVVVALLGVALSLTIWVRAENAHRAELTSMLGAIADRTAARVDWQMQREIDGIRFLTSLLQVGRKEWGPAWSLRAGLILQEYPGIDWLAWVGPDSTVRAFSGRDTAAHMNPEVLRQAAFQLKSQVPTIQDRWNDAYEFQAFLPLMVDTARMGVVVGQVRVDSLWVRRQPSLLGNLSVNLLADDDRMIPLRHVPDSLAPAWMIMRRSVNTPSGATVRVDVAPSNEFVRQVSSPWPVVFLVMGVFLSVAIGGLLIQFLGLRDFSNALELSNRSLDNRVHELSRRDEELRRLNDELAERVQIRTAELARALREVETFNHSVSHDLRSPIGAILNFSAVLEEDHGAKIEPAGHRLLERIHGAATRANQLLDSLSEFTTSEIQPGAIQRLNMNDLADRAYAQALGREPSAADAAFARSELPAAMGDPELVHRVFVNLLGNALKYSRGRKPRSIQVRGEEGAAENVYRVTDNGSGFDPSRAEEMFEAFHRLHGTEVEGSGLGLAIVSKIIGRLGGRVWAESDGVNGATFFFTLPPLGESAT